MTKESKIIGLNLGSGKDWAYESWLGIDEVNGEVLTKNSVFPFSDDSISFIYSSHFFEHVSDETALNLLKESFRVLKPGGVFRMVVPDFALFLKKYRENDCEWYSRNGGLDGRPEWPQFGVKNTLSNILLHWLSNYDFKSEEGFYRGPPRGIDEKEVKARAFDNSLEEFCNWIHSKVPVKDPRVKTQHINWWDSKKMKKFAMSSGFLSFLQKQYMETDFTEFTDSDMFDSWQPGRKEFSLFFEFVK